MTTEDGTHLMFFAAGYLLAVFSFWVVRRTMKFEHRFTMRIEQVERPDDPADYWKQN